MKPDTVTSAPLTLEDDREQAARLGISMTLLLDMHRDATFPKPIWLSPNSKRHVIALVDEWVLSRRERPGDYAEQARRRAVLAAAALRANRAARKAASAQAAVEGAAT